MRRWVAYFGTVGVLSLVFLLVPAEVTQAAIVPQCPTDGCRACDLVTLANNVMKFLLMISVFVAALLLAIAGLRSVVKGENAELTNTAINIFLGIVIMLVGWLVIDTIMRVLTGSRLGPWNTIECKSNTPLVKFAEKPTGSVSVVPGGPADTYTPPGKSVDTDSNGNPLPAELGRADCSPENIMSAAQAGGYNLTQAQANTLSCLSGPESGCRNNPGQATTPGGQPTTASGVFQIVMGYPDDCHSLNIPACTQAAQSAGYNVSGNLQCSNAFSGGRAKPGMEDLAAACRAAASNFTCNTAAAACLVQRQPNFRDWTADSRSSRQAACISQFNQ